MKYDQEVVFVDRDGKRYPAKITGYDADGKLPATYNGAKMTADEAGLNGVKTAGAAVDENGIGKLCDPCEIKEVKACALSNGNKRPYCDLLVNVGGGKRGEKWNLVPGVAYAGSAALATGGEIKPKQKFELLPKVVRRKSDDEK